MKKFRLLALVLVIALLVPQLAFAADEEIVPEPRLLTVSENRIAVVLHTNDIHGYVVGDDASIIGFDRIATIKKAFIEMYGENVILADAGDFSSGKPFASFTKGVAPIYAMNAAGYDVATPGNHEFDFANQLPVISELGEFDFISANIKKLNGEGEAEAVLAPTSVWQLDNGLKVGFVGLTTPYTVTSANPLNTAGYEFGDIESIVADINTFAAELREEGCDIVVALCHLGRSTNPADASSDALAAAIEPGTVDIIIDGHSHTTPDKNEEVNGTWIVSTGGDGRQSLGVIAFEETEDGFVVTPSYISAADAIADYEPDEEVAAVLEELNAPIVELSKTVAGTVDVFLDGERANVRSKETNLANTITDALRAYTGAEIAIQNGGSIRASIAEGEFTYADLFTTLTYTNDVKVAAVTGQVVVDALENGVSGLESGAGKFPQVSGISYTFDLARAPGNRITEVLFGEEPIDLEAEYVLATNDYMSIGGDDYSMFIEPFTVPLAWEAPEGSNGSPIVTDIFAWYIAEFGASEVEGRITVLEAPVVRATYATVLVDGEEIEFDAYEIDGYNHFKLRDLAFVLAETESAFNVEYDEELDAIVITIDEVYEAVGDELEARELETVVAYITDSVVYFGDEVVEISGYNIADYNYFKLRDVATLIDFGVEWDGEAEIITIDSAASYVAP